MTVTFFIKKNSDAPVILADAGIVDCSVSYKANGVDSMTFAQVDDYAATPTWPFSTVVALIRREVSGGVTTDRCVFVGTVETIPCSASDGQESVVYTAMGPAYWLQRCDFSQTWAYTDDGGIASTGWEPTVVLGENSSGTRLSSGQVISGVASYAIGRGLKIQLGSISSGTWTPLDERTNITCWDAIVSMLRYTPDNVLWFDYNASVDGVYVPRLNVYAPSIMTTVVKALHSSDAIQAGFTPRYDLRVPGILVCFRFTSEIDNKTVKTRVFQSAGSYNDARRVSLVYDLEGERRVFVEQPIKVEAYPDDFTSDAGKAFLVAMIPSLSQMQNSDWTILDVTGDGEHQYLNRLVEGSICSWMPVDKEDETFKAHIAYTYRDSSTGVILEKGEKDLFFKAVSTNATTKTYRRETEYESAEPVPSNLASSLYASWNRLHWDGQVTFMEGDCSFDLTPGKLISLTGGHSEWATMAALVQDVTINIDAGTTSVRTGTCGRLEADNLMAIYRAARGRTYSYTRLSRNDSESDHKAVSGAEAMSKDAIADGTPCRKRYRFRIENKDSADRLHCVDIDPASIVFATSGNAAPQTLQLREMLIPYDDSGTVKAKLAQVLCGASYGTAKNLQTRMVDPTAPAVLGTNSAGSSDDALTDTYNPLTATDDGVSLWVLCRERFSYNGSKIWYSYYRMLTWPKAIAPTISSETQVTTDTPQA